MEPMNNCFISALLVALVIFALIGVGFTGAGLYELYALWKDGRKK